MDADRFPNLKALEAIAQMLHYILSPSSTTHFSSPYSKRKWQTPFFSRALIQSSLISNKHLFAGDRVAWIMTPFSPCIEVEYVLCIHHKRYHIYLLSAWKNLFLPCLQTNFLYLLELFLRIPPETFVYISFPRGEDIFYDIFGVFDFGYCLFHEAMEILPFRNQVSWYRDLTQEYHLH